MSFGFVLGAFLAFYLVSKLLQYAPHLIWRRYGGAPGGDPVGKRLRSVRTIAHRGGKASTVENSMQAFKNAFIHSNMIELDVWLTKDKRVVVLHDGTLDRVTGSPGHVTQMNYRDLPTLTKQADTGAFRGAGSKIPLLEEVLDAMDSEKGFPIIVEVKQCSEELVRRVDEILCGRPSLRDCVVWFSLDQRIGNLLCRQNPLRPRIFSVRHVAVTYLLYYLMLLPLVPTNWLGGDGGACIFGLKVGDMSLGLLRRVPLLGRANKRCLDFVNRTLKSVMASRGLVDHLSRRGIPTFVLGVNTHHELATAMGLRPSAFLTDNPEWLGAVLKI